jgi:hypothetical protein
MESLALAVLVAVVQVAITVLFHQAEQQILAVAVVVQDCLEQPLAQVVLV